jgi:nucleoside-diphosphate-sugar epimerase
MRIGVTGAAGFIGSHLCERLLAEGREVVGVDDLSHGSAENVAACLNDDAFAFRELDCVDAGALRQLFAGCDAVVHLAARKIPRYGGALRTLEANVASARAVFDVARAEHAQVVLASTSDVYGNAPPPLREDGELTLGPPTTRRWAYASSKLYNEHLGLALAEERGLRVTILRLFGCYGPRNHPSWWGGPQAVFAESLLDGRPMEIHGDGLQVRTFTFVSDTVEAFVRALDTPEAVGEIVNVGIDRPTTILSLAAQVQAALGVAPPARTEHVSYESFGGRYQDVRRRIPDTEKAARLLGFRAWVELDAGLAETVAWHRARRTSAAAGEPPAAVGVG